MVFDGAEDVTWVGKVHNTCPLTGFFQWPELNVPLVHLYLYFNLSSCNQHHLGWLLNARCTQCSCCLKQYNRTSWNVKFVYLKVFEVDMILVHFVQWKTWASACLSLDMSLRQASLIVGMFFMRLWGLSGKVCQF